MIEVGPLQSTEIIASRTFGVSYQSAIWAVAHRLCRLVWKILHEGVRFIEQSVQVGPRERKNALRCWREPSASSATRSPSPP